MIGKMTPKAPSYLNSRLQGYETLGYLEPRNHYLGNWRTLVIISAILPVLIIVVITINVVVIVADYNLGFSLLSLLGSEKLLQRDHRHVGGSEGHAAAAHAPKETQQFKQLLWYPKPMQSEP